MSGPVHARRSGSEPVPAARGVPPAAVEREQVRADALEPLTTLVARIAAATGRPALLGAVCDGTLALLGAERCRLHLVDADDPDARPVATAATGVGRDRPPHPPVDAPERGCLAVRVAAGDAGEGVLSVERTLPFRSQERRALELVAAQAAASLRTIALVERLTEETLARDLFEAIAAGRPEHAVARARAARVDPDRPHVVVVLEPRSPDDRWAGAAGLPGRLRRVAPGALCHPGAGRVRALVPLSSAAPAALRALDEGLGRVARAAGAAAGRSSVQAGLAASAASLGEAAGAARISRALDPAGGVRAWDALGAYRYLLGVGAGEEPDARHATAVRALRDYDDRRGSELVGTLERYLTDRSVVPTARALQIHANTLRQRLERIEQTTGLLLAEEDLVSLELAIKLHRLRAGP